MTSPRRQVPRWAARRCRPGVAVHGRSPLRWGTIVHEIHATSRSTVELSAPIHDRTVPGTGAAEQEHVGGDGWPRQGAWPIVGVPLQLVVSQHVEAMGSATHPLRRPRDDAHGGPGRRTARFRGEWERAVGGGGETPGKRRPRALPGAAQRGSRSEQGRRTRKGPRGASPDGWYVHHLHVRIGG